MKERDGGLGVACVCMSMSVQLLRVFFFFALICLRCLLSGSLERVVTDDVNY